MIKDSQDSLAYRFLINLAIYGRDVQWDDQQLIELKDTVLYEVIRYGLWRRETNNERTGFFVMFLAGSSVIMKLRSSGRIS